MPVALGNLYHQADNPRRSTTTMNLGRYRKFIIALGGLATTAGAFLADGEISQNDIIGIALAAVAAAGVYAARNDPMP